jgi:hypothetical protein
MPRRPFQVRRRMAREADFTGNRQKDKQREWGGPALPAATCSACLAKTSPPLDEARLAYWLPWVSNLQERPYIPRRATTIFREKRAARRHNR